MSDPISVLVADDEEAMRFFLAKTLGRAGYAVTAVENGRQAVDRVVEGSFDVILDDGTQRNRNHLNRSYYGLYIPPLIWREIDNFSSGSVCLVLASEFYNEEDYFRVYQEFQTAVKEGT